MSMSDRSFSATSEFPNKYLGVSKQDTTRKPSCHWQTRATRKHDKNCSSSTCLQRCRWQYWSIFISL